MDWLSVSDWVSQQARARAGHHALEWNDRALTYRTLERSAAHVARALSTRIASSPDARLGGGPPVVAIIASDPLLLASGVLGTLRAGAAFAPMDPLTPVSRMQTMLAQASPVCVLADTAHLSVAREATSALASAPDTLHLAELPDGGELIDVRLDPDARCYLYFTSGSTGVPKAIAGRLKAIDHFVRWEIEAFRVGPDSRVSQLASPAFDAWLKDVFVPWCAGGTACAPPDRTVVWQPSRFADWIDSTRLTHLHCVPTMFRSLLAAPLTAERFPALQYVVLAGETLLPSDVDRWMDIFGERIRLANLYGPSETTLIKLCHLVTAADRGARTVPIGKAIDGAEVLVVDDEQRPCAPGMVGEIWIRTPYRSHGYHQQPEATAAAFIVNPFTGDPGDIVYRTGDFGRFRDDGALEFAGRKDGQVKIRGARLELQDVEDVLRRCEVVNDAAVVALGEDSALSLAAAVVLRSGASIDVVMRHLAAHLAPSMIPTEVAVVDTLPKTSTGKVDRRVVAEQIRAANAPEPPDAPLTEIQQQIAAVWITVLDVERVRLHDNFFNLGGHSLMATQVVSRVRQQLDADLSIVDLFSCPTLASFTERVEEVLATRGLDDVFADFGDATFDPSAVGGRPSEADAWKER